jgi:hypothetical protein
MSEKALSPGADKQGRYIFIARKGATFRMNFIAEMIHCKPSYHDREFLIFNSFLLARCGFTLVNPTL